MHHLKNSLEHANGAFISDINISIGWHHFYWDNEKGRRVKSLPACWKNSSIFHPVDQFFKRDINSTWSLWEVFQSSNPFTHFLLDWVLSLEHRLVMKSYCSGNSTCRDLDLQIICNRIWTECLHLRGAGAFPTLFFTEIDPQKYIPWF